MCMISSTYVGVPPYYVNSVIIPSSEASSHQTHLEISYIIDLNNKTTIENIKITFTKTISRSNLINLIQKDLPPLYSDLVQSKKHWKSKMCNKWHLFRRLNNSMEQLSLICECKLTYHMLLLLRSSFHGWR